MDRKAGIIIGGVRKWLSVYTMWALLTLGSIASSFWSVERKRRVDRLSSRDSCCKTWQSKYSPSLLFTHCAITVLLKMKYMKWGTVLAWGLIWIKFQEIEHQFFMTISMEKIMTNSRHFAWLWFHLYGSMFHVNLTFAKKKKLIPFFKGSPS